MTSDIKTRAQIFGENLRRIRKQKNITRKQLAAVLNVSEVAIFQYENGVNLPKLDKIFEIADFLKVSIVDLIGDSGYAPSEIDAKKQIFEYRLKRALEIVNKIGIQAAITNDKIKLAFYDIEHKPAREIKISGVQTLVNDIDPVQRNIELSKDLFIKIVELEEDRLFLLEIEEDLKADFKKFGKEI